MTNLSWQFLKLDLDARGVATLTLNRPDIHNAFNEVVISEITSCVQQLAKDDKVRLLIITGAGKSFCAGADVNWMKKMKTYSFQENVTDAKGMAHMFHTINKFPKPVIAKINGSALGGGVGLMAVADYCLAVDSSIFGLTEARLGLVPAVISPFVLAKIGHGQARATFLSGGRFNSLRAKEMGLIHEITNSVDLDDATAKVVDEFLKAGPEAQRVAKDLIFKVGHLMSQVDSEKDVLNFTTETIAKVRAGDEGQEGMSSLLEKRNPRWSN